MNMICLNGKWEMKDFVGEDWVWRNAEKPNTRDVRFWQTATVPGSVYYDLMRNGHAFGIPNPYFELNSMLAEWVPERTWVFRKTFIVPKELAGKTIKLHFKGIDYEGLFFINGEPLGSHAGMFIPAVFDVSDKLKYGEENHISVVLQKAPDEQPQVSKTCYVKTHKSRMTYWWDFCPRMVHVGIWDDVYLDVTEGVEIEDVFVRPTIAVDEANLMIDIELNSRASKDVRVETVIMYQNQQVGVKESQMIAVDHCSLAHNIKIQNPKLWFPNGYGEQPLYRAVVKIFDDTRCTEQREVVFGIRDVQFVPNETVDKTANPFTIVVNSVKIYMKGWNWVPMDVMYGVSNPEKLERLLTLAKKANVNMLRVWGGGLIERDNFYDLCNRFGIMIWQEFIQSSSGIENKPSTDKAFIDMMVREAEIIVKRKRNNPSLVIWCGGNELSDVNGNALTDEEPVLGALRKVVNHLDPTRYWHPTSPQGRAFNNNLENIQNDPTGLHDVHGPWEHQGLKEHCTLYNAGTSLLSSEFGVEGMANLKTLNATIAEEHQWPPSRENPYYFHRGSWWVNYPLIQKIFANKITDVKTLIKASQRMQADGLRYAVESNLRRAFTSSGTFPWQFNEPYPNAYCTSSVDYFAQPKPAYYAVARAYAPNMISASFETQAWAGSDTFNAQIWFVQAGLTNVQSIKGSVSLVDLHGNVYGKAEFDTTATKPSQKVFDYATSLTNLQNGLFFLDIQTDVGAARYLFSKTDNLSDLLTLGQAELNVSWKDENTLVVKNTGAVTAVGLRLEDGKNLDQSGYVYFDDNYVDLLPGETKEFVLQFVDIPVEERLITMSAFNLDAIVKHSLE